MGFSKEHEKKEWALVTLTSAHPGCGFILVGVVKSCTGGWNSDHATQPIEILCSAAD